MNIFKELQDNLMEVAKKSDKRILTGPEMKEALHGPTATKEEVAELLEVSEEKIGLTTIKTICCYCQDKIREITVKSNLPKNVVSHGMCESCFKQDVYKLGGKELYDFVESHKKNAA